MAFTTTDLWFGNIPESFAAVSLHPHHLFDIRERALYTSFENHIGACISKLNFWYWTGETEIRSPILWGGGRQ
jgi:hypothetical protein